MAKILVVDDDKPLCEIIQDWLTYEEHVVEVAHGGVDCWQRLQNQDYDLVILDWDLPDLNGIDVLKRYRQSGGTIPIIMLTGKTAVEDKVTGLDTGASDYLPKPFHMKELSVRIRTALRNAGVARKSVPKPLGSGNEKVLRAGNLVGTTLAGRYEFLEILGEGGLSIVFKARNPRLHKLVAIKMLRASELKEDSRARFEREALAISRLDHANIITVYDFGITENDHPYMVMEYLPGKTLEDLIDEQDRIPLRAGLDFMLQAADALAHAHEMGVLHRDIKPSNIMVKQVAGREPLVKILDFGLAKFTGRDSVRFRRLTRPSQILGSPLYISPERINGQQADERSDIYSLGCVLFETVTGYPPHCGDTTVEIMYKHLQEPPLTLAEARPEVKFPSGLQPLLSRLLEKDPNKRPQTVREVRDELERIARNLKIGEARG
ncbi:MAG TPA: protein kinase [Candidatus Obscuribacterales bacterium]